MLVETAPVDLEDVIKAGPVRESARLSKLLWIFVWIGIIAFTVGLFGAVDPAILWGSYYTSLIYFMGLAAGSVMIPVIFTIVGAKWSIPVRRIAEANVAFLPFAWVLLMVTWAGREYLFPWARGPMPGKEFWMQDWFVYARFAVLLAFLFYMQWRFVRISLRADMGMLLEHVEKRGFEQWRKRQGFFYNLLTKGWRGFDKENPELQRKLVWNAPVVTLFYAVIYSMFAFEMIMAMDPYWISNMFGGFIFVGNIYIGWAMLGFLVNRISKADPNYAKVVHNQQRWDIGKLTFAFCMLWGYLFFSQFLPQWYGNLPEETQWLILRTRDWDLPWVRLAWVVFPLCFIIPFVLLLSRDVKRTPGAYNIVAVIILIGVWLERYILVMPGISQDHFPLSWIDGCLFLGFLGAWGLCVQSFLNKVPFLPVSHPALHQHQD